MSLQTIIDKINASGTAPPCPGCGKPGKLVLRMSAEGPFFILGCPGVMDENWKPEVDAFALPITAVDGLLKAHGIKPEKVFKKVMELVTRSRREQRALESDQIVLTE